MNVAFDPWIPVVTISGKPELASLETVLCHGGQFADLAVRPHERVALMRLFLCVAHAALNGPQDYDEWLEVPDKLPEAVKKYLKKWKDSFEFFHKEKPWLQVAGLSKKQAEPKDLEDLTGWTQVSKLNFSLATGNNTTLFDHQGMGNVRDLELAQIVLSMLTFQCFSPGGLISQVYWHGEQSCKSSKDAPCVPSSMIHAFLRGLNLSSSIYLNLPSYDDIHLRYGECAIGHPVWEAMPDLLTDFNNVENATRSYLGRLLPMTRIMFFHPSCEYLLLGDGLVYPSFTDGYPPEPTATVVIRKNGNNEERALLSFRPSRALWRELAAMVVKRKIGGTGGPLCLQAIQDDQSCDLIVVALARDKATIVDTIESVFHVPSRLNSSDGASEYDAEVKIAENIAGKLSWAIEIYRHVTDQGWAGRLKMAGAGKSQLKAKLHSQATLRYWTTVEHNLSLLMSHIEVIGTDDAIPTRKKWRKMLFQSACDAYRVACGQETPRQMRAFAKGWQKLTTTKKTSETHTDNHKEERHELAS